MSESDRATSEFVAALRRLAPKLDKDISRCLALIERDEALLSQAVRMPYFPLVVERAAGSLVWDADGNEYVDYLGSAATVMLGHCPDSIVSAVKRQLDKLICYNIGYVYHSPAVELAERLVAITPGSMRKRVSYGLSGSDVCDGAYHLARTAAGRPGFIAFRGGYHGVTVGAHNLTSLDSGMKRGCPPLLGGIARVPYPDCYRCPLRCRPEDCGMACLESLEETLRMEIPPSQVAGLMVEPVQGDAGIIVPPAGYLSRLAEICRREGILFVAEEVQTGFGRTGYTFAVEADGVVPDILVLGKAIGGGMALSALVARAELMESPDWRSPAHTFTHGGNPLSCVGSLAAIDEFLAQDLTGRARRLGEKLRVELAGLAGEFEVIGDVRGRGLMFGLDIVTDRDSKRRHRDLAKKICFRAWEKGLVLTFLNGNVLRITPALNIPEELLWRGVGIIRESIRDALAGKVPDDVLKVAVGR